MTALQTEPLFPHQKDAADRIAKGVPTYLGFDMGIGKTRTFIEAARARGAWRVLVLCPASAILVWKREIARWHTGKVWCGVVRQPSDLYNQHPRPISNPDATNYYLVTHGLMSQREGAIAKALDEGPAFDMTAIDEAQAFNAPSNIRVNALRKIKRKLGLIIPLSGTPMKNHAGDLYTLLDVCWPQGLHKMTRADYEARFCVVQHRDFQRNGRLVRVIEGSKNIHELRKLIAPFMVRKRKDEVFKDLPPVLWDTVPVLLDTSLFPETEAQQLERELATLISAAGFDNMAATLAALAKVPHIMARRRLLGLAKLRSATEYIVDMLENLPRDRKVLVFAHHAGVIASLVEHLGQYLPAVLTGGSSQSEREAAVNTFLTNDQCRVFVGNIQAAGTALTLVGPRCKCSDVVFVESSWTPMDNAQAACRVHRIGQKDGVVVRMLSAAGTVDDMINALLVRKAREFTELLDNQGEEDGSRSHAQR